MKAALLIALAGCTSRPHDPERADAVLAAIPDTASADACATGHVDKVKFARAAGCSNDGSVEFCIPDGDPVLQAALTALSPEITCAPGGGRAGCAQPPGRLLCFYKTAVPEQCTTTHGAMTDEGWSTVCNLAARDEVVEIVPTFLE